MKLMQFVLINGMNAIIKKKNRSISCCPKDPFEINVQNGFVDLYRSEWKLLFPNRASTRMYCGMIS